MLVDMHIHEARYSPDSHIYLEDIVARAKSMGLDCIGITDHDSMGLKDYAERYSRKVGFPIYVGIEYFSLQGDIVAYGIDSYPQTRVSAQEFIDFVHERNGFCSACHPFRNNNRGLEENLLQVKNLDALEALNGSTLWEANKKAYSYAQIIGAKTIGVSDAHVIQNLGKYATYIKGVAPATTEEFVALLKSSELHPAVYTDEGYQVLKQVDFGCQKLLDRQYA